jgi:hypothetical protein
MKNIYLENKGMLFVTYILLLSICQLVLDFFNRSLLGFLSISIILYIFTEDIFDVRPYDLKELSVWFSGLSEAYKTAALSSILTVIGFLIAFHAATSSWKKQMIMELKLSVASEIDMQYTRILDLINIIKPYIDSNLEFIGQIGEDAKPKEDIMFTFNYLQSKLEEFEMNRKELVSLSSRIYQIYGKHSMVLFSDLSTFKDIEAANAGISEMSEMVWVHIPKLAVTIDENNYDMCVNHYLKYIKEDRLIILSDLCEEINAMVSSLTGMVKGRLTGGLWKMNLAYIINIFKIRMHIADALLIGKMGKMKYNTNIKK